MTDVEPSRNKGSRAGLFQRMGGFREVNHIRLERIGSIALAAVALLAVAAPAAGSTWKAGKRAPHVALAGGGVAWYTSRPDGGRALYAAQPGRKPRRVESFPPPREPAVFIGGAFAGSASTVVLENATYIPGNQVDSGGSGGVDLYAGASGGRLDLLNRCGGGLGSALGRIDVSGTRVAFQRCDEKLEVRDLAGGTAPQVVGLSVRAVRIAGRYVAWLEGGYDSTPSPSRADIVVYDLEAGAEAYRIPAAAIATSVQSFSLQGDGKVAFAFDPSFDDTNPRLLVAWASRSEPSVHRVPIKRRLSYSIRLRRDRIVFSGYSSARETAPEELGVTDLKGRSRLIVRKGSGLGIDFDGKHVAYAHRTKRGYEVVRRSLRP